jgi:hypothetical protein
MKNQFNDLTNNLQGLDPKIKDKAINIAIELIKKKKMNRESALKEGIKQAKEWFLDLEG